MSLSSTVVTAEDLPDEVWVNVFRYIEPLATYPAASLVCRRWRELLQDHEVWRTYFQRLIGGSPHEHILATDNVFYDNFKWITKHTSRLPHTEQIRFAVSFGHNQLFRSLLRLPAVQKIYEKAQNFRVFSHNRNILQTAAEHGYDDIVFACFSECASVEVTDALLGEASNYFDDLGMNTFHIAAFRGQRNILQYLLKHPLPEGTLDILTEEPTAPTRTGQQSGFSPLHLAAENGHSGIVQLLLDHGASVNIQDPTNNQTPLHFACRSGHRSCIQILLQHQADPIAKTKASRSPEDIARNAGYHALADLLADFAVDRQATFPTPTDDWHLYFGGQYEVLARRYLQWMVEAHRELVLPGVDSGTDSAPPSIDLESVYLSLKVDRAGSYERLQAFQRLESQVVELEARADTVFKPEERHAAVVSQLIESPSMPSLLHQTNEEDIISLGQAFQSERGLVVLGDPGGGKTTLARWVALQLARSLLNKKERVHVVASQVHAKNATTRRADTLIDVGITRLPVLVRVADFAQHLEKAKDKGRVTLAGYLGYHPWQGSFPSSDGMELRLDTLHELIEDSLRRGRAVIIIDGLDEVANPQQRQEVVDHVDKFTWQWIYRQDPSEFDALEGWERLQAIDRAREHLGRPVDTGGNQLVVTSRIAGYHSAPMRSPLTHVTIQPMQQSSIKNFCASWMIAVHKIENKGEHDPTVVIQSALDESEKLHQAIWEQPGVRRLAENPLLLTILALVFRKQKMSLPKRRAQLYRVAMSILVDVWRDCGLTLDETIRTLAPLAAYLHQNRAMGLISKEELHSLILTARLDMYAKEGNSISRDEVDAEVSRFVRVVGDQVGFLVARGESMFGFLHQSFQEYLAGWHLVGGDTASIGVSKAAENFIAHIGDARWREPLLLALGMLSERWEERKKEEMLHLLLQSDNNSSGALMPRASLLMVTALSEMNSLPVLVGKKLQVLLVLSYSNQNKYDSNSFELLRYRIEKAFEDIMRMSEDQVKSFFFQALSHPEDTMQLAFKEHLAPMQRVQDFCCGSAEIIYKLKIFSPDICSALQNALEYDEAKWGWVIHRCLRCFVSRKPPTTYNRDIKLSEVWIHLPFHRNFPHPPTDRIHKYFIASLCGGFQDFNVVATTHEYYGYVNLLQMVDEARHAIYEQNRSFERWGDRVNASYNIAVHLDTFIPRLFWKEKPVFSIHTLHRWSELLTVLPFTCEKNAFNEAKLRDILMYVLRKFSPPTNLSKSKLTNAFSSIRSLLTKDTPAPVDSDTLSALVMLDVKRLKTDALIGLISMGVDVRKLLMEDSISLQCNLEQLDSVVHSFRDPAARSRFHLYPCLVKLKECFSASQFEHVLIASLCMVTRATDLLDISAAIGVTRQANNREDVLLANVMEDHPLAIAFYLLDRLASLNSDDREYYAALCAESLLHRNEPSEFASAFVQVPILYRKIAQNISFADPWPVGSTLCAPIWSRTEEHFPLEVLSAVEVIPLNWWKSYILEYFAMSASRDHPEYMSEILTVCFFCVESETGTDPFNGLPLPVGYAELPPQETLIKLASGQVDPYYRARALWRLCRYIPQDESYDSVLHGALHAALVIPDAHRRVVITERIVEMLPRSEAISIFGDLCTWAMVISNKNNRARALARLSISSLARPEQSSELLKNAIRASNGIADEYERASLLNELHHVISQVNGRKEILMWHKAVDKLSDPWCTAFAEGKYGQILFACGKHLTSDTQLEDPWMALTLYALFEDAKSVADLPMNWNSRLWSSILEDHWHTRAFETLREQAVAPGSYGIALDQYAASSIGSLIQKAYHMRSNPAKVEMAKTLYDRIYQLLSLAGEVSSDVLNQVPHWKDALESGPDSEFAEYEKKILQQIALIEAEKAILNKESIPYVLDLIQFGDDRSRLRAQVALHGESFSTSNSSRRLRTSVLGLESLLMLAEASWNGIKQKRLMLSQTIRWMGHDIIHDDESIVHSLVSLYEQAKDERELYISSLWLGTCECISENAWKAWLKLLPKGAASERVQSILLIGVCKTAHSASHCGGNWPAGAFSQFLECGYDPEVVGRLTCCEEWPISVANAALVALRNNTQGADYVELANEAFARNRAQQNLANSMGSLEELAAFGKSYFHHYNSNNRVESCVPRAVMQLINTPQILPSVILPWLYDCLQQPQAFATIEYDSCSYRKLDSLLQVASGLAQRLPVTFQNCATLQLAGLLGRATEESVSAFGRIAAMELLSIYGHVSAQTVNAMKSALLDVSFVAESALICTKRFRYLDDDLLESLIKELYHRFPSMCLAAAKILSAVYLEPCTSSSQRSIILEALAEALKHPSIKNKPVFTMINTAKKITVNHASETMICCVGDLDQALFHELSFVCGFTTADNPSPVSLPPDLVPPPGAPE